MARRQALYHSPSTTSFGRRQHAKGGRQTADHACRSPAQGTRQPQQAQAGGWQRLLYSHNRRAALSHRRNLKPKRRAGGASRGFATSGHVTTGFIQVKGVVSPAGTQFKGQVNELATGEKADCFHAASQRMLTAVTHLSLHKL
ncbi:hypothetical protein WJX79_002009 [Trebouxia sp. C0005]